MTTGMRTWIEGSPATGFSETRSPQGCTRAIVGADRQFVKCMFFKNV